MVRLCEIENEDNKENEPNRNAEPVRTNGHDKETPETPDINTEIEIDAISSIENNDIEIQNIESVEPPPAAPKPTEVKNVLDVYQRSK